MKPSLARLTMNAARNGYVTLLTWGLTNTGHPVIASAKTVRKGKPA